MEVVTIHEAIKDTFLWRDSTKLQWWLDLLFLSEDGVVDISIRGLQARWGTGSHNTIRAFLTNLEACGLIKTECVNDTRQCTMSVTHPKGGSITRITICEQTSCGIIEVCQQGVAMTHVSDTPDRHTAKKTPKEIKAEKEARLERARLAFIEDLRPYVEIYGREMINEFYAYWSEPNKSKSKMRFEQERTWDLERRLTRWSNNNKDKNNGNNQPNDTMQYVINRIAAAQ